MKEPRLQAPSVMLDGGDELQAIGISADPPKVVASSPAVMEHYVRRMP